MDEHFKISALFCLQKAVSTLAILAQTCLDVADIFLHFFLNNNLFKKYHKLYVKLKSGPSTFTK